MSRQRIHPYWVERIRQLTEQGAGSTTITAQLKAEATRLEIGKSPAEKTVRNNIKTHRAAPEQERRQYSQVYWPESFGTPELPWESAPAVLEAMRLSGEGKRLTMRAAKWLWRLTLAGPVFPAGDREDQLWTLLMWARKLAACEVSGLPGAEEPWREVEKQLLHTGGMVPPEWPDNATILSLRPAAMKTAIDEMLFYIQAQDNIEERRMRKLKGEGKAES